MGTQTPIYIGIDPCGGRHPFTYAAIDADFQLLLLAAGEMEDEPAYLQSQPTAVVAINAPPRPNMGLVRKMKVDQGLTAGHLRRADLRQVEQELGEHGILVSPTPSRKETCAAWVQAGFNLYNHIETAGYQAYPAENAAHQWLETHPHAGFCVLLGQRPLPKPTLEGRLQRQLVLHGQDMGIKDPMDFFEEITRHRLLNGILPMELIYTAEELDALVAAFTANLAAREPGDVLLLGNREEGQLVLPVPELKEMYS